MTSSAIIVGSAVAGSSAEWSFGFEHLADPRTQGWLLVSSYKPVAAWMIFYLLAVLYLPKISKSFKPLKLQKSLIIYNALMALLNFHIFKELLINSSRLNYNYWCQPCRVVYSTHEMKLAAAVWWFYLSKLLEFSDSVFFIVRHKWNQLTPLHIYHHSTVFFMWWIAVKWLPTGSTFFPALLNAFVHIIMYSYYGLSACGPAMQKHLWWKKYLTALQLIQFSIGLIWTIQSILYQCDISSWTKYAAAIYMSSFLVLFGRFYRRKYRCNKNIKSL